MFGLTKTPKIPIGDNRPTLPIGIQLISEDDFAAELERETDNLRHGIIDRHHDAAQRGLDEMRIRKAALEVEITRLTEEHRQAAISIAAFEVAIATLDAGRLPKREDATADASTSTD